MVDPPEYRHRNCSPRRILRLGVQSVAARTGCRPAKLFLLRPAVDVRFAQWSDPRFERFLSLQRTHGAASAADAGRSTASSRGRARMDVEAGSVAKIHRPGRTLFHPGAD